MQSYTSERFYDVHELDVNDDHLNFERPVQCPRSPIKLAGPSDKRVVHFQSTTNQTGPSSIRQRLSPQKQFVQRAQSQICTSVAGFQSLIPFQRNEATDPLSHLLHPKFRHTPNADRCVGLLLHCVILSALVIAGLGYRLLAGLARFTVDVTIQYIIYRGDIRPLRRAAAPRGDLQRATMMTSLGLRLVVVRDDGGRIEETPPLETPLIESLPSTSQTSVSVRSTEFSRRTSSSSSSSYNIGSISVMTDIRTPQDFNS